MRGPRVQARRAPILGLILAALAPAAHAQVTTSLSLESDYRVRGVSLTDRRPALSLTVDYDHPGGAYVGGSLIASDSERGRFEPLANVEYVGFAHRAEAGLSWDVGVRNQNVSVWGGGRHRRLQYGEVYFGLSHDDITARAHYSPSAFNTAPASLYVEVDAALRRTENWRLLGHVGVFTPLERLPGPGGRGERYDLRLGVAREFERGELRLGWTTTFPKPWSQFSYSGSSITAGATVYF